MIIGKRINRFNLVQYLVKTISEGVEIIEWTYVDDIDRKDLIEIFNALIPSARNLTIRTAVTCTRRDLEKEWKTQRVLLQEKNNLPAAAPSQSLPDRGNDPWSSGARCGGDPENTHLQKDKMQL